MRTAAYGARSVAAPLEPIEIERRELRRNDVAIEIAYCGVCHTDLHIVQNAWRSTQYPCVPGHEIVGRVTAIGDHVARHRVGDIVAVGCMVDSCLSCDQCLREQENYCREGWTGTYNGRDRISGEITLGGYSERIVVRKEFVLRVPQALDRSKVGPLLCAGITVYSPLREWKIGPGSRIGIAGLGGLGHLAVKFGVALGAEVVVLTRSDAKKDIALGLGASQVIVASDSSAMLDVNATLSLILDTIPVKHDINPYLPLLDVDGTLVVVGQIGPIESASTYPMVFKRARLAGSLFGGIAETQEMLDFCAEHQLLPDVEMISIDGVNAAFDRMEQGDLHHRFVIDMAMRSSS